VLKPTSRLFILTGADNFEIKRVKLKKQGLSITKYQQTYIPAGFPGLMWSAIYSNFASIQKPVAVFLHEGQIQSLRRSSFTL
jgi:hypothetical protein